MNPTADDPNGPAERMRVEVLAAALARLGVDTCRLGMVLGSGLKAFADVVEDRVEVPCAELPHWPVPRIEGHGGSVVVGRVGGLPVVCVTGRVHRYEGWSVGDVVRGLRSLRLAGVPAFLLTNAAGGIRTDFVPGDLMLIEDHLNLTGASPMTGPHVDAFGPRFSDQSAVYDRALMARLGSLDAELKRGVYAGLSGPTYETPAEVRMLRALGADAVGMSTVPEAMALRAMGTRVVGLSLISNHAAGISPVPLSHAEVVEAGQRAQGRLEALVTGFCRSLAADPVDDR
jgi:purine-nucleoside phosphorylase